jgi:hypothetical protein
LIEISKYKILRSHVKTIHWCTKNLIQANSSSSLIVKGTITRPQRKGNYRACLKQSYKNTSPHTKPHLQDTKKYIGSNITKLQPKIDIAEAVNNHDSSWKQTKTKQNAWNEIPPNYLLKHFWGFQQHPYYKLDQNFNLFKLQIQEIVLIFSTTSSTSNVSLLVIP